jgi:hypothetical protein
VIVVGSCGTMSSAHFLVSSRIGTLGGVITGRLNSAGELCIGQEKGVKRKEPYRLVLQHTSWVSWLEALRWADTRKEGTFKERRMEDEYNVRSIRVRLYGIAVG